MLPSRAYADPPAPFSANLRAQASAADARPALVVVVDEEEVDCYPSSPYVRLTARTTTEAARLIERWKPRAIVIDWELDRIDGPAICIAARQHGSTGMLAVMSEPQRAPSALKAGCNAVLLKPFVRNLVAARLGRLCRDRRPAHAGRPGTPLQSWGTNRVFLEVACPKCRSGGAVCFDHASPRHEWYACFACDHVWLGHRQE